MKKTITLLLSIVLLLGCFAGCKGKSDEGSEWEWVDSEITVTNKVEKEKDKDSNGSDKKNNTSKKNNTKKDNYKPGSKGEEIKIGDEKFVYGTDKNADYSVKGTITVAVNSYRNSDYEQITKSFQALYPNVKIKTVIFESTTDDATEYLTSLDMSKKDLPDIIFDDAGCLPTYITNGWMYPLTDFVNKDADYKNVPASISDRFTFNGNVFALGQSLHSNAVLINKDLVAKVNQKMPSVSWNWSDFETFIRACTNDSYCGIDDLQNSYNWLPGSMSQNCTIAGYRYATKDFDLNSSCKPAVDFVLKMNNTHSVVATSLKQNSQSGTSDYVKKFGDISGTNAAFFAGKVAAMFSGTWSYGSINKRDLAFDWEFYPAPQTKKGRIPTHVDYCWMSTDVKKENVNAAWQYLRFVTYSSEGNIARLSSYDNDHYSDDMFCAYYIPCTKNPLVVQKFKTDLPAVTDAVKYIYDNLENSYAGDPEKFVPGFEENVEYSIVLKPVFEAMSGKYDFTSKIAETQSKANTEIKKYETQFNQSLKKFLSEFKPVHK